MNQLINELLAYAKAGMNERKVDLKPVELNELFDHLSDKLQITDSLKRKLPASCVVIAEPFLLERALSNVLRNSIRYAGNSGPIEIEVIEVGDEIVLTISDRGPGVPEEAITRLGEPFFRPESSRTRESGGVGLGLAIVKTCVEACEGTFSIQNRIGGGLDVSVRLKCAKSNAHSRKLVTSGC